MFLQLHHPCLRNGDALIVGGTIGYGESGLLRIRNYVLHILVPKCAQQTEEEISFRQAPRQLFLCGEVLCQQFILHGVLVQVLHGDLLVVRHLHVVDLFLFEVRFGLAQDIAHEPHLGTMHRWKEHVHYIIDQHPRVLLPCCVRYR